MLLDDLQWVDRRSAAAISFAARRVHEAALATVASLREPLPPPVDMAGIEPLAVRPLDDTAANELAAHHGVPPSTSPSRTPACSTSCASGRMISRRLWSSRRRLAKCCRSSPARRAIWSQCSTPCWRTLYASAKRSLDRFISTTETGSASAYYIMHHPPLPSFAGENRCFIPHQGRLLHRSSQQSGRLIPAT